MYIYLFVRQKKLLEMIIVGDHTQKHIFLSGYSGEIFTFYFMDNHNPPTIHSLLCMQFIIVNCGYLLVEARVETTFICF